MKAVPYRLHQVLICNGLVMEGSAEDTRNKSLLPA